MYKKILNAIDAIFINLILYVIIFVWIRYYTDSLLLTIFVALFTTMAVYVLGKVVFGYKKYENAVSVEKQKAIECCTLSLCLLTRNERSTLFSTIYPGYQTISLLHLDEVKRQDILKCIMRKNRNHQVIFVKSLPISVKKFFNSLALQNVNIVLQSELYDKLKEHNALPPVVEIKKQRITAKEVLSLAFSRKRAKGYAFTGMLLIFTSFIVPYKLYYIITGSILLILSLVCLGFKTE